MALGAGEARTLSQESPQKNPQIMHPNRLLEAQWMWQRAGRRVLSIQFQFGWKHMNSTGHSFCSSIYVPEDN